MAKRGPIGLSISQLRQILASRQSDLKKLTKQRKALQKQLNAIDARIARLGGEARGTRNGAVSSGGGKRARNSTSLVATLEQVLGAKGKPMNVGEIVDGVLASGYRSSSPAFRSIVNQTLIKEKKKFTSTGRGVYQMKK